MAFENWAAFALASVVLLVIPGPTVMIALSYALTKGRASAWATIPGVVLGDFTAMTVSLLGAGAVLAASATLFNLLKILGAVYLIWLGIQLWRSEPAVVGKVDAGSATSARRMFWNAYIVTALNPKSIVFFIAFVPQFVDPSAPVLVQFVILEATFLVLAALSILIWVLAAAQLRNRLSRAGTLRKANRIGGSFLIGAGLLTAATRRLG